MTSEEYLKGLPAMHFVFDDYPEDNEYSEEQLLAFAEAYHKAKSEEQTAKIDQLIEDYERRVAMSEIVMAESEIQIQIERVNIKKSVYRQIIDDLKKLKG